MPAFYGPIDLSKNELRQAVIQNLGSAPSSPSKGQIYMNSADNTLYWFDGTVWVAARDAGSAALYYQTIKATGAAQTQRAALNFNSGGTGINFSVSDDAANNETDITAQPQYGTITVETAYGSAPSNGAAVTMARSDHAHGNPPLTSVAPTAARIGATAAVGTGLAPAREDHTHGWTTPLLALDMNGFMIQNVATPQTAGDAATKGYVDNAIGGLSWKQSVRLASTANLALTGLLTVDGVISQSNDRILVKNQSTTSANGIYTAASGAWTRVADADVGTEMEGAAVFVEEGNTLADTAWVCTANAPITIGSTGLPFAQFVGGGSVTAGAGMTQSGNTLDVVAADASITVTADAIAVNTTALTAFFPKKFSAALTGTAAYATGEVVTHNLNTRDVHVAVVNGSTPYQAVEVDWEATTANAVTLRFNPALGAGFRAVVFG